MHVDPLTPFIIIRPFFYGQNSSNLGEFYMKQALDRFGIMCLLLQNLSLKYPVEPVPKYLFVVHLVLKSKINFNI